MQSSISQAQNLLIPQKPQKKLKPYLCPCQKSYGSYPALYSHIKRKHDGIAPGQVIKPKASRKRGRPFKFQHTIDNNHVMKENARHLVDYFDKMREGEFPFKGMMANPNYNRQLHQRQTHGNAYRHHDQYEKYDKYEQYERRDPNNIGSMPFFGSQNYLGDNRISNFSSQPYHPQIPLQYQSPLQQNKPSYHSSHYQPIHSKHQIKSSFSQFYMPQNYQKEQFNQKYQHQFLDLIHQRPFALKLKQEMDLKMGSIEKGLTQLFQPILTQIMRDGQDDYNLIQVEKQGQQPIELNQVNQQHFQQINNKNQAINNPNIKLQNNKLCPTIPDLLSLAHFSSIYTWLISPLPCLTHPRLTQNYIQSSFRLSFIQFLSYANQFLQTIQYQQLLLMIVFLVDYVLGKTESFREEGEPNGGEVGTWFGGYLDDYVQEVRHKVNIGHFFLWQDDYKLKQTKVLLYFSSWLTLKQYLQNKYNRQMIKDQLQRQNHKAIQYQRNYSQYISAAIQQDFIKNSPQIQQKVEQDIQIIQTHKSLIDCQQIIQPLYQQDQNDQSAQSEWNEQLQNMKELSKNKQN